MQDVLDLYVRRGGEIFDVGVWQYLRSLGGLADEKYSAKALEEILEEYLGDLRLSQLLKPCMVTAYDIEKRRAVFFTQHDAKVDPAQDFLVRDVVRATSAVPSYFEPPLIESMAHERFPLVDGGVFAANPAMCAYAEARHKMPGKPGARRMVMLSLGTGKVEKAYEYQKAKDWGGLGWIKPIIDMMISSNAETVHFQLIQLFAAAGCSSQYLRLDTELPEEAADMDNASDENLQRLVEIGQEVADDSDEKLDAFVELLVV
jgi:patatin-like phospholipase/acyl hydrolase